MQLSQSMNKERMLIMIVTARNFHTFIIEPKCNLLVDIIHYANTESQQYFWKKFEKEGKFSFLDVQIYPILNWQNISVFSLGIINIRLNRSPS